MSDNLSSDFLPEWLELPYTFIDMSQWTEWEKVPLARRTALRMALEGSGCVSQDVLWDARLWLQWLENLPEDNIDLVRTVRGWWEAQWRMRDLTRDASVWQQRVLL